MDICTLKLQLRHSETQADTLNKIYKPKLKQYSGLINRRLNTQGNQKINNCKKYLVKKSHKNNVVSWLGNQRKYINKSCTFKAQKQDQNTINNNINMNQNTAIVVALDDSSYKNNNRIIKKLPTRENTINLKQHQHKINNNFIQKYQERSNILNQTMNINMNKNKLRCRNLKKNYMNCVFYDESMFNQANQEKYKQKQKQQQKQKQRQKERKHLPGMKLPKDQNVKQNKQIQKYQLLQDKLLGAGTFGRVYAGVNIKTGEKVAIKKVYNDKAYKSRQIELMQLITSDHVIKILDKFITTQPNILLNSNPHQLYQQKQKRQQQKQYINIVMPKYQSNLYQHLKSNNYKISPHLLKLYLYQIFKGILHLHSKGICHRDLKPHNILIKNNKLVICDLGSAKLLKKDQSNISYICSRCYRAPQLIFGATFYGVGIDIWSIGCIIVEILNKGPLFIGKDSLHHLIQVMKVMGTPTPKQISIMNPNFDTSSCRLPMVKKIEWKHLFSSCDSKLLDLIQKIMVYNPKLRITASQAIKHTYFDDIRNSQFLQKMSNQVDVTNLLYFDPGEVKMLRGGAFRN